MNNEWEKETLARQLHDWYLKATEKEDAKYNHSAVVPYDDLAEGQKLIDRYIAEKVLSLLASQRADWHRSEIEKLEKYKSEMKIPYQALRLAGGCPSCGEATNQDFIDNEFKEAVSQAITSIITRYKEELKELTGEYE